ncbi:NAD(P)H-dependent glycerol-3-phosphate dehydrogenase [Pseudorhodoferax sp.]|uniref:NAD(P)H-dependent glycerol-3-phosphate dehydrogenase n=1 Tax=Pseudorhodoferax sp. TaxID=1993553 RepID=UPI002DD6A0EA|nr:NAD(P)H-dependent glycerol-3-phosphate dehydrogenase [Pseudorhodoferax sp.]
MKIAVLGAGAWGTALAVHASRLGHAVTLWARDATQAEHMQAQRVNARYLPDTPLPAELALASGPLAPVCATQELLVIATPMAALRAMLAELAPLGLPLAWLCKGFEAGGAGLLGHEIHQAVGAGVPFGVLSGPSFAQEVAAGQPTALVAASADAALRERLVLAFHGATLRVYSSDDVPGVEVGGAVKNVLAIATGLCDGLALGLNARAALVTRGLAEMTRLGLALGARAETFMGLSGLGDLVLTATGDLSRNRKVGLLLARGMSLAEAVASLGHVAEGVYSARTVLARAAALGVHMPITESVVALLDGQVQPQEAVATLMGREPTADGV